MVSQLPLQLVQCYSRGSFKNTNNFLELHNSIQATVAAVGQEPDAVNNIFSWVFILTLPQPPHQSC